MSVFAYECDYCQSPVDVRVGKKTGLAYYNCAACGFRVNIRPGSKAHSDLVTAGLIPSSSARRE